MYVDTDIFDDPETVFRRRNNKEEEDFKVDKSKYTPDSSPVRHPNQVGLLAEVTGTRVQFIITDKAKGRRGGGNVSVL